MNIKEWIINNLSSNSIVIEAGTCEGYDTKFFSDYFVGGMIYAFEPIKTHFDQTMNIINDRKNVELKNIALSDKTGKSEMYVSERFGEPWGSSSLLSPKLHLENHPQITFNKKVEVETINLDEWFENKSIEKVDFMWLDMQGYEPFVLQSSPNILSKTRFIYSEVSTKENYDNIMLYPDYKNMMADKGFEIVFEAILWDDGGDVLFKNINI